MPDERFASARSAIPPQVVDRLGMSLEELGLLRDRLTEVIAAVQRG